MPIITVPVTCVAHDQSGNPVAGAQFTFELVRKGVNNRVTRVTELYNGLVAPELIEAIAGPDGVAVVQLFPNALGVKGSQYRVTAINPDDGEMFLSGLATIPNAPCELHLVMEVEPLPPLNDAQVALAGAQAFANTANNHRIAAQGHMEAADADRQQTNLDRIATGEDREATAEDRAVVEGITQQFGTVQEAIDGAQAAEAHAVKVLPRYGAMPPVSPEPGQEWIYTDGRRFTWLVDDDASGQWVEAATAIALEPAVMAAFAAAGGSSLVGFLQSGTGAVARTIQSKLRDLPVSVKDFGAAGDGINDDTSAIVAAFAASKVVHFPAGTYRITDTIDIDSSYGVQITGAGANVFGSGHTRIVMDVDNKAHFSIWGPCLVHSIAFDWKNQQTTTHTESTPIKLNWVSRFSLRNIYVKRSNTSIKIPQEAFTSGANAVYAGEITNVWSYSASECHFDLRGFNGGNTNIDVGPLYANGDYLMDLNPVPPTVTANGQSCNYIIRLKNCSGIQLGAISCDGLVVNECAVEIDNCYGTIDTLRFEGVQFKKNSAFFMQFVGGYNGFDVAMLEFRSCWTLIGDTPTSFHFIRVNAPDSRISIGMLRFSKTQINSALGRILVTGNINAASDIRIGTIWVEADSTGIDAGVWSEGNSYYPPVVREWNGFPTARTRQAGRSSTVRHEIFTGGSVPAATTVGAPAVGDRARPLSPGDFGRPTEWTYLGTAWVPSAFLGGDKAVAFNSTDADFTLTPQVSRQTVRHNGTLTANRTITLDTTGAWNGCTFRITRTGGGAFNLSVGGLKNLAQNTWCEVTFDGTNWFLAQYGTL